MYVEYMLNIFERNMSELLASLNNDCTILHDVPHVYDCMCMQVDGSHLVHDQLEKEETILAIKGCNQIYALCCNV